MIRAGPLYIRFEQPEEFCPKLARELRTTIREKHVAEPLRSEYRAHEDNGQIARRCCLFDGLDPNSSRQAIRETYNHVVSVASAREFRKNVEHTTLKRDTGIGIGVGIPRVLALYDLFL